MVDMQDILSKGDLISLFHPSPRGYDKMAHAWMTAILALDLGKCASSLSERAYKWSLRQRNVSQKSENSGESSLNS
jgi:hypothetical protein